MSAAVVIWMMEKDFINAVDIYHALATDSSESGANVDVMAKKNDCRDIMVHCFILIHYGFGGRGGCCGPMWVMAPSILRFSRSHTMMHHGR
jgi:hypothetical protein